MAVLNEDGNNPSESERLMREVMRGTRASMHDFRSFVGITREQVEFEEESSIAEQARVVEIRKEVGERRGE